MDPNELKAGDYVEFFSPDNKPSQLATVIKIDRVAKKAEILIQNEKNPFHIFSQDQWDQILPHPIFCQDLYAFGFYETSLETAYGWTAREWTKMSIDKKYVFHLSYNSPCWDLEVFWIDGMMHRSIMHNGIKYLHQLQHILRQYD